MTPTPPRQPEQEQCTCGMNTSIRSWHLPQCPLREPPGAVDLAAILARLEDERALAYLFDTGDRRAIRLMIQEAAEALGKVDRLTRALQRIADWSDCLCEHDSADCCALVQDIDFHCPGCIATCALEGKPFHDGAYQIQKRDG